MRIHPLLTILLLAPPPALRAQSEAALKEAFEGRSVQVKIAMPGTDDGVDIYPGTAKPLDYSRHASRLKENGTAIKAGDQAMVTKIKVKTKLIEFQLDGGGYGTMGDETSSTVPVAATPKSKHEENLEDQLKRTSDPALRKQLEDELDDLEEDREREDARNRAHVAEAEETKKANIRERRLQGGSRFNLRYENGVPSEALTPDGIKAALAAYVDFPGPFAQEPPHEGLPVQVGNTARAGSTNGLPMKGMLMTEVDQMLGKPDRTSDRMEGRLKVTTQVYRAQAGQVTAEFVEGVLIRYTMTSN
jgi:hypothetical protein